MDKAIYRCYILRGVSGAGKSTLAQVIAEQHDKAIVLGADDLFYDGDDYKFERSRLGEAHANCWKRFERILSLKSHRCIIIDNVNARSTEIAPYYHAATVNGWDVKLITIVCPPELALRGAAASDHHTPAELIWKWHQLLLTEQIPSWWNQSVHFVHLEEGERWLSPPVALMEAKQAVEPVTKSTKAWQNFSVHTRQKVYNRFLKSGSNQVTNSARMIALKILKEAEKG